MASGRLDTCIAGDRNACARMRCAKPGITLLNSTMQSDCFSLQHCPSRAGHTCPSVIPHRSRSTSVQGLPLSKPGPKGDSEHMHALIDPASGLASAIADLHHTAHHTFPHHRHAPCTHPFEKTHALHKSRAAKPKARWPWPGDTPTPQRPSPAATHCPAAGVALPEQPGGGQPLLNTSLHSKNRIPHHSR